MARTLSQMLPLGTKAPEFALPDTRPGVEGKIVRLDDFAGAPAYLVMFICNHCPFVVHIRESLLALTRRFMAEGVAVIAINSNDAVAYPADSPSAMTKFARDFNVAFPYVFDESQEVAKAYQAACTPDFYVFDKERRLAYRGRMDESRPGNGVVNDGADLVAALTAVLAGKAPSPEQLPSMGCNIKWKV